MLEELNYKTIKNMVYEIRGRRVMLDFDLAQIFGYETKALNKQVKNNMNLFDEKDRFIIEPEEWNNILRCKNFTANVTANFLSKRRTLPYAFTEKGIFVLTTILKPKDDICRGNVELLNEYLRQSDNIEILEKAHNKAINYEIVRFESGEISLDVRVSPTTRTIQN